MEFHPSTSLHPTPKERKHYDIFDWFVLGKTSKTKAKYIEKMITEKKNILICGGTGGGKTTVLEVVGQTIPKEYKVVLASYIEGEVQIKRDHLLQLEIPRDHPGPLFTFLNSHSTFDTLLIDEMRDGFSEILHSMMNFSNRSHILTQHALDPIQGLQRLSHLVDENMKANKEISDQIDTIILTNRNHAGERIMQVFEVLPYNEVTEEFMIQEIL